MAKRKKAQKKPLKKKPVRKLDVVFDCPFCNHNQCVEIRMERLRAIGTLRCRVCSTNFDSKISLDVYCEWIDACHKLNTAKSRKEGY